MHSFQFQALIQYYWVVGNIILILVLDSLSFLSIEFLIVNGRLLVLLVLAHQIVHVALGLGELHLVHALPGVPVEERLAPEHRRELLRDPLKQLLDGGRVANESGGHLESPWWDVTDSSLHIIRDPLDEVAGIPGGSRSPPPPSSPRR